MDQLTLKPNRAVAVTYRRIIGILSSLAFGVGLIIIASLLPEGTGLLRPFLVVIGALVLLNAPFILWVTKVRYEKTSYRFEKARIVVTSGGPFSDSTTELEIRNVTNVKLILPWIEHRLFGTGAVHVESAGTGGVEAHLLFLDEPERVYGIVQGLMRSNGFRLSSENAIMEERASPLGALVDVLSAGFTTFLILFYFGGIILIPASIVSPWFLLLALPVIAIAGLGFYAYYRNSISKTYTITEDRISYDEGFLTKRRAVIPIENLSNSHINEPFLKRIFGVSDVLVSCQGSGSEISFRNLPDAKRFDASVKSLIDAERAPNAEQSEQSEHRGEVRAAARKRAERTRRVAPTTTSTYKPSARPILIGAGALIVVLLVLGGIGGVIAAAFGTLGAAIPIAGAIPFIILMSSGVFVTAFIRVAITTYTLEPNRVKSESNLFNRSEHAFNDDRLTRITVTRTLLDRIARTVNVEFWSIGSGDRIRFSAVDERSGIVTAVHEKYGLREPTQHRIVSEPRISTIMRAHAYGVIAALIVLAAAGLVSIFWFPALVIGIGLVVVIGSITIILEKLAYRNAYFVVDEKTLYETHGWLTRAQSYVDVEDIKGVTTSQYPFGSDGSIEFNVAGEGIIKTDKGEQIVPNTITIPYVARALEQSESLSTALDEFAPPSEARRIATIAAVRVAVPILLVGIIVPLLPIVLIAASLAAVRAGRTRFLIEDERIVREVKFLYLTRTVLFYDRIDHLTTNEGFFDKLFGTGTVQVTTTGSSRVEMSVGPTKDHRRVHEALDAAYR